MFYTILKNYARFRLRYPVYIFHHIPKCGGTSVRSVLNEWFHVNEDYFDRNQEAKPPVDLRYLNSHNCVCGHFGHQDYMLERRYPQVFNSRKAHKRYRVFSFLRDPLKMRCSLFRHQSAMQTIDSENLADGIMPLNNYYSRIMGVNEANYQQKLDQYFFIGIQDEMQSSFDLLASLIKKPKIVLPVENKSEASKKTRLDYLTTDEIARFKQANQLDYQIFDYAQKRFDRLKNQFN